MSARWQDILGKNRTYSEAFKDYGKEVVHWEVLDISTDQDLLFRIISTNSQNLQGVRLAIDVGDGYIEIDGMKAKGMYLWENTCPKEIKVHCHAPEGKLSVYNIFDRGIERGGIRSLTDSCGMIVEEKDKTYRYHCNDYGFQTNFDKLVFEIEFV